MPKGLYIKGTTHRLLDLTDAQLANLVDNLEEETADDRDYYVDESVIVYLESRGADRDLIAALRRALGVRGSSGVRAGAYREETGIEIEWREE